METIPINLLNSFIIFNESKNLVEAANRLRITQPALTKQLQQLEKAMKEPIFTIQGRKKVLTPFGRVLQERLKERLGNIQEVVRQTRELYQTAHHTKLRIVGRRGVLDRILLKLNFDGALLFLESSNDSVIESLMNLTAEIGITHLVPNSYELMAKPLFKEEFQLVIPKSLLSIKPNLGELLFFRLKDLPCLGYKENDELINSICLFYSLEPSAIKMIRATENYSSITSMVVAKMGWAIIPSYLKISKKDTWIIPLPAKALPVRQFFVVYRSEFNSIPWFKALLLNIQSCF